MPTPTYLFYDLETTGLSRSFDQILQFAAIRVDSDFNEIERFNMRVSLSPDVIPNPAALLVNRTHPNQFSEGLDEYEAIKKIYEIVNQPGTISLGYNTLGFDDEFLRFSFFRHLLPPYRHQYANDCHRMDIYPMVLLAHHIQPNLLQWPILNEKISFKLANLVQKNELSSGESHDALVDVLDTIALAKKLKSDGAFWRKAIGLFNKKNDVDTIQACSRRCQIDSASYAVGFMMESKPFESLVPVLNLGRGDPEKNLTQWLRLDTVILCDCPPESLFDQVDVIRKKDGEPPFFFTFDDVSCGSTLSDTNRAAVENNLAFLNKNPSVFTAIRQHFFNRCYADHFHYDANAALYKLPFPTSNEESLFRKFHFIDRARKGEVLSAFSQPAHRALAIRLLGRHMPEALSSGEKADYEEYKWYVFSATPDNAMVDHRGEKKLTLTAALAETEKLLLTKTTPYEQSMLHELKIRYQNSAVSRTRQRDSVAEQGFFGGLPQPNRHDTVSAVEVNQNEATL